MKTKCKNTPKRLYLQLTGSDRQLKCRAKLWGKKKTTFNCKPLQDDLKITINTQVRRELPRRGGCDKAGGQNVAL